VLSVLDVWSILMLASFTLIRRDKANLVAVKVSCVYDDSVLMTADSGHYAFFIVDI